MFLNIDQKNPADIAAIDDHEDSLTYGELVRFCDHFGEVLDKRTLIFIYRRIVSVHLQDTSVHFRIKSYR